MHVRVDYGHLYRDVSASRVHMVSFMRGRIRMANATISATDDLLNSEILRVGCLTRGHNIVGCDRCDVVSACKRGD